MRLVFLHGPAAAGKYTVAKELAALTGFELYHNHIVVDAVLQRHRFGTPAFVADRDRRWREFFGQFPAPGRPDIIFTFNPENTVPQAFIDWLFAEPARRGAAFISVGIAAPEEIVEARLASPQRRQFGKLTDVILYRQLRDTGAFATPIIPRTDLRIDTSALAPAAAAAQIARHFRLIPDQAARG